MKAGKIYALTILDIVDEILKTDQNIIFELLAVSGSTIPKDVDVVDVVMGDFQRHRYLEILTLATEAGLLWP